MERNSREWLVPLLGIASIVLLVVSFVVQGSPTSADHPPSEVQQWYQDNKNAAEISAFIGVVAAAGLIFFGAYLRKVLEAAEGPGSMLPILVVIGVSIVAVGGAIDGMLLFAAAEAADDIPGPEIQTIQAIWDNDFLPFFLGSLVFLWSAGLSVLRSGVLPKWLGWFAIVFGVISLAGPLGFIGALGAGVWIIIVSIMLSMRARRPAAAPPAPAPAA
ncbi:MAG TPA: hypothetical protein VH501_05525 [Solirubrobacterales bacterium]|jgi:hypothetical protein